LGIWLVSGARRVPRPAAGMTAFFTSLDIGQDIFYVIKRSCVKCQTLWKRDILVKIIMVAGSFQSLGSA
jgi:hypothetical protein